MTKELQDRNNSIINEVIKKIERTCPGSIDMIAISGSFATGDYYDKSDLDLVIIKNNDLADNISTCFIMDEIGYDIYTSTWSDFEKMSKYENPYVSKLKQLDIIYTRNEKVANRYKELQAKLNDNMGNDELINHNVSKIYSKMLANYDAIMNVDTISNAYKILGNFMNNVESFLFLINKKYVSHGTKSIPEEISKMEILPGDILNKYNSLIDSRGTNEIIEKIYSIIEILNKYLEGKNIKVNIAENEKTRPKKELKSNDLTGSFEELYSNYYNKLKYASENNNKYLSFRTMIDAQGFFDEYSDSFDIEPIDLIGNYNPDNLKENFESFALSMLKWKNLYDKYYKKVNIIKNIDDLYDNKRVFDAFVDKPEKELFKKIETEAKKNSLTKKGNKRI